MSTNDPGPGSPSTSARAARPPTDDPGARAAGRAGRGAAPAWSAGAVGRRRRRGRRRRLRRWSQLIGGGSSPATAVPADAIGYVSLDLDPSASQKIEAIKILRKFPALKEEIKIGSRDDLRRRCSRRSSRTATARAWTTTTTCSPGSASRVARGRRTGQQAGSLPLVVLQVSDQDEGEGGGREAREPATPSDD